MTAKDETMTTPKRLSVLFSLAALVAACSGSPGTPDPPTELVGESAASLTDAYESEATPNGIGQTKCTAPVAKSKDGTRDITFVAFGDPQAVAPKLSGYECGENPSFDAGQMDSIRAAINGIEGHSWPKGFNKAGKSYSSIRGVLLAGDLTQTGSDPEPIPSPSLDCKEYTLFRHAFGLCGNEGALKFPTYGTFGNHDFPWIKSADAGGASGYHPVTGYLDSVTPMRAEAGTDDYYYDASVPGTGFYAWRWDDTWFVSIGVKPGTEIEPLHKPRNGQAATRLIDPMDSLGFLKKFLQSRTKSKKRQIVVLAHYPMGTHRIKKQERKAFCGLIHDAQKGKGAFSDGPRLAKDYPVVLLHGHTHHLPGAKQFTCPKPYRNIEIPQFDLGSPFHHKKHQKLALAKDERVHDGMDGKRVETVNFTVFHLGNKYVEAIGIGAHMGSPDKWHRVYEKRLGILKKP